MTAVTKFKAVHGSDLPLRIRKAASKILILAEDPDEVVLLSRIKSVEAKGEAKHILDLSSTVTIKFEAWYCPIYFDAENPELIIHRDFTAVLETNTLIKGAFDQGIAEWDVSDRFDTASNLGLPPKGYAKLVEEIADLHLDEVIEWLALGNGVPLELSPKVRELYQEHADGCNDNVEDGLISDLQEA